MRAPVEHDGGFVLTKEQHVEAIDLSRRIVMALLGGDPNGDCSKEALDLKWEKLSRMYPNAPCHMGKEKHVSE